MASCCDTKQRTETAYFVTGIDIFFAISYTDFAKMEK
jgi:hypothetical protein